MVFNATFNNIVVKWEGSGAMVTVIFYIIIWQSRHLPWWYIILTYDVFFYV
jgi:hypothetical protein